MFTVNNNGHRNGSMLLYYKIPFSVIVVLRQAMDGLELAMQT